MVACGTLTWTVDRSRTRAKVQVLKAYEDHLKFVTALVACNHFLFTWTDWSNCPWNYRRNQETFVAPQTKADPLTAKQQRKRTHQVCHVLYAKARSGWISIKATLVPVLEQFDEKKVWKSLLYPFPFFCFKTKAHDRILSYFSRKEWISESNKSAE